MTDLVLLAETSIYRLFGTKYRAWHKHHLHYQDIYISIIILLDKTAIKRVIQLTIVHCTPVATNVRVP